jgi:hypothetical protein
MGSSFVTRTSVLTASLSTSMALWVLKAYLLKLLSRQCQGKVMGMRTSRQPSAFGTKKTELAIDKSPNQEIDCSNDCLVIKQIGGG